MSAIPFTTVEDAIWDFVSESSGLPDDQIIWAHQAGKRPINPVVMLAWVAFGRYGRDWVSYKLAEAPITPGQEVVAKYRGMRMAHLSIQVFSYDASGESSPIDIVSSILAGHKPHVRALRRAGIGSGLFNQIPLIGGDRLGSVPEPRAVLDWTIHLKSEVTGFETLIQRIELGRRVLSSGGTELLDDEVEVYLGGPVTLEAAVGGASAGQDADLTVT